MKLILMLTVIGTVLIAAGLLGLWMDVTKRLMDIEADIKESKKHISRNRRRIKVLEDRDADESDKIIIQREWNKSDVRYPSQEGL